MSPLRTLLPCLLVGLTTVASAQTAAPKAAAPAKDWNAQYTLGPDSQEKAGVPKGVVTKFRLDDSKTFPGYGREWALYVPSQYDGKKEACLMVFQDGMGYIGPKGNWRVATVFDNLIAEGKMPVTIALFINPGFALDKNNPNGKGKDGKPLGKSNRSFEYDNVTDKYVTFLLEEMIPLAESKGYKISKDPKRRGIAAPPPAASAPSTPLGSARTPSARSSPPSAASPTSAASSPTARKSAATSSPGWSWRVPRRTSASTRRTARTT
jgi:hypothetical protein